jgi:hypothetical protein
MGSNRSAMLRHATVGLALASALLAGCASAPLASKAEDDDARTMTVPEGKALVYVYRPGLVAALSRFETWVNGHLVGEIAVRSYYAVVLEPGKVRVDFPFGNSAATVRFQANAGKRYSVLQGLDRIVLVDRAVLTLTGEGEQAGVPEGCRLIKKVSLPGRYDDGARTIAMPAPADKALVYVYRGRWSDRVAELPVAVDGSAEVPCGKRAFLLVASPPGPVVLTARSEKPARLGLDVVSGRKYFVRVLETGFWTPQPVLEQVDDERIATAELDGLRLAGALVSR